jgi:hypothetical protein
MTARSRWPAEAAGAAAHQLPGFSERVLSPASMKARKPRLGERTFAGMGVPG